MSDDKPSTHANAKDILRAMGYRIPPDRPSVIWQRNIHYTPTGTSTTITITPQGYRYFEELDKYRRQFDRDAEKRAAPVAPKTDIKRSPTHARDERLRQARAFQAEFKKQATSGYLKAQAGKVARNGKGPKNGLDL